MMSFCRKSVHSLLGLSNTNTTDHNHDNQYHDDHNHHDDLINPSAIWSKGLISLVTATNDTTRRRSPNVLESSAPQMTAKPSAPPRGLGFIDDIGGGVDGLMSCTESLGFESSDERRLDDDADIDGPPRPLKLSEKWSSRRRAAAAEGRKFPPPLPSLGRNGRPSFFLRPVRKDGRLELTEVRINRPEILRAYREDGRLRLHLIRDDDDDDDDENCIEEEAEQEREDNDDEIVSGGAGAGGGSEEWKFPVSCKGGGGGEGSFRRCQEKLELHHHAVWRQHCVGHQARRLHVAV